MPGFFVNRWLLLPNPTGKARLCPAGSTLPHLPVPAVPLDNQEWILWKINVILLLEASTRPAWDKSGLRWSRRPLGSSLRNITSDWAAISTPTRGCVRSPARRLLGVWHIWWRGSRGVQLELSPSSCKKSREWEGATMFQTHDCQSLQTTY